MLSDVWHVILLLLLSECQFLRTFCLIEHFEFGLVKWTQLYIPEFFINQCQRSIHVVSTFHLVMGKSALTS